MRRDSRGLTLIETMVTLGVFSMLLVFIFNTFSISTAIFQDTDVRQATETQMKSIKLLLQRDLELGDFWFINSVSRPQMDATLRDALAVGTLADWDDPAQFDATTGRPGWNRYIVWYATQEDPGRMIRQVVEPGGGVPLPGAYAGLSTNLNDGDPNLNADLLISRTLSDRVKNFAVTPRLQNGTIQITIRLESRGAKRANSVDNTVENLGLDLVFRPRNTWPEI
jgi:prepilin-type N-terminal cleavage/methylation domain-containing protein